MPLLPPPHTIPYPGGRCPSFNRAQKEEAELLMAIFKDHVKFPTLQRGSDGNVIVDFHPQYFDPTAGFTIFPTFVALVHKKTYVECTNYVRRNTPATASSRQPQPQTREPWP